MAAATQLINTGTAWRLKGMRGGNDGALQNEMKRQVWTARRMAKSVEKRERLMPRDAASLTRLPQGPSENERSYAD